MTTAEQRYLRSIIQAVRIDKAINEAQEQLEFCLEIGYDKAAAQLAFDIDMMEYFFKLTLLVAEKAYSDLLFERIMKGEIQIYAVY